MAHHHSCCRVALTEAQKRKEQQDSERQSSANVSLSSEQNMTLERIISGEASGWLTVLPLAMEGFDLSATQFRDQLALRYHCQPVALPCVCHGCGDAFNMQHALDCKKGGPVKKGHNDVRDNDARLAEAA